MNRNKLVCILTLLLFILNNGFGFVYADPLADTQCPEGSKLLNSCYSTPDEIQTYITTMNQLINSISLEVVKEEGDEYESEIVGIGKGLYGAGKTVVEGVHMNSILIGTMTKDFGTDFFANFKIVWNSSAAVRDRKKLILIDELLANRIRKIGWINKYDKPITDPGEIAQINLLLKDIKLFDEITINANTTYGDLLKLLRGVQAAYKNIYLDVVGSADISPMDGKDPLYYGLQALIETKQLNNKMTIKLRESIISSYIETLTLRYKCSTGSTNSCPGALGVFTDNVNKILMIAEKSAENPLVKFSDSWSRLEVALKDMTGTPSNEKDYQERKEALLKQYYGGDAKKILDCSKTRDCMYGIGMAWDTIKDTASADFMKPISDATEKLPEILSKQKDDLREPPISIGKFAKEQSMKNLELDFEGVATTIVDLHNRDTGNVTMEQPHAATMIIPYISKRVYEGINIIGNVKDKEGIIWNMGEACRNQCVNFGGICRYY